MWSDNFDDELVPFSGLNLLSKSENKMKIGNSDSTAADEWVTVPETSKTMFQLLFQAVMRSGENFALKTRQGLHNRVS